MSVRVTKGTFSSKSKSHKSKKPSKKKAPERVLSLILNPKFSQKGISFKTIAKCARLSSRQYASTIVNRLEAEGKIFIEHTEYEHPRFPTAQCCGRNIYSPGPKAPKKFQRPQKSEKKTEKNDPKSRVKDPQNYDTNFSKNSSKEEFAKKGVNFLISSSDGLKNSSKSKRRATKPKRKTTRYGKKGIFELFGLEKHFPYRPHWWFRDMRRLNRALRLISHKIAGGYRIKNFTKFLTHLLSHGVFGYRRHLARKLSLSIVTPSLERAEPYFASDSIAAGYGALSDLKKKHGLNMSFKNIERLLKKGFDHLGLSAQAVLKRLQLGGIRNVNAFLHFAVSMKEPYDLLKPKSSH